MSSARKQGLFLAVKDKMIALARKRGVFMAVERTDKKETSFRGCLFFVYLSSLRSWSASYRKIKKKNLPLLEL